MTTEEAIAVGSFVVAMASLAWGIVIHIRNDIRTAKKVKKLEKVVKNHKCPGSGT